MMLRSEIVKALAQIVEPKRILVSLEDIYVYSFEKILEDRRDSNFDVVVKTTSKEEISQIERLANMEGFTVVRRGQNVDFYETGKTNNKVVLLDIAPAPDIADFDKRFSRRAAEIKEAKHGLTNVLRSGGRTYKSFASVIETLLTEKAIFRCEDCEVCTGYCTVSPHFDHIETWSAKGRYLLTRGFARGEVKPSKRLADILYSCTLCGSCYIQCIPTSHIHEAILEIRGKMAEAGLAPESAQAAFKNIREYGNPLGSSVSQRSHWMKMLRADLLSEKADTLYWVGCNTALRSGIRKTAAATVRVLNEAGVKVMTFGEKEGCCGVPMIFGGLFQDAKQNAQRVSEAIDDANVETLVTSCSGCYETFVNFYPNKLGVELPCEVLHTSQLVERLLREGRLSPHRLKMRISYHDPCGLGRHCNVYDPPRNVLKSIPDLQLVEPFMSRERSRCCGGGGGFWGVNSKASMSLAHLRITEDIASLNVNVLTTACPLCYTNFLYTSTRHALGMRIYDIMEILDMALKEED